VRRKAAKRILPWDLPVDQIQLASSSPQDEFIRETKRPRLEEPLPTTATYEATTKNTPHDTAVAPPPDADTAAADASADPVTDTQPKPKAGATPWTRRWTPEEDAKVTSAFRNTCKKKGCKNSVWAAVAALVPGRTKGQCAARWHDCSKPCIDGVNGHNTGTWKEDEDRKLEDSVRTHGVKDWVLIATLVSGRTKWQCQDRWYYSLRCVTDKTTRRRGQWTESEDIKLMGLVHTHGGNNWDKIAALVPDRTRLQCHKRWNALSRSIDRANGRDRWTAVEDSKLGESVQMHVRKDLALSPSVDRANGRADRWTTVEDSNLMEAVQMHYGKDWAAITALVPGRTTMQCRNRWHVSLKHSVDGATRRTGKWTSEEDINLKDLVDTHGNNNWDEIATLVSGRTKRRCRSRWQECMIGS
jgi:hypothetical protein